MTTELASQLEALLHSPLAALTITLAAFQMGSWLYLKTGKFSLFHPIMSGAAIAAGLIELLDIPFPVYQSGNQLLMFLLGSATVALALPLYRCRALLVEARWPILFCTVVGASMACLLALALAWAFGGNQETLLAVTSKSVTTPIAIALAMELGATVAIAMGAVIITGLVAITLGAALLKWLKIEDDRVWGFCIGVTGHAIGTARAFERSQQAGAFASLGLGLTGIFTALVLPVAMRFI